MPATKRPLKVFLSHAHSDAKCRARSGRGGCVPFKEFQPGRLSPEGSAHRLGRSRDAARRRDFRRPGAFRRM